ncbi:MAG: hypothetical protein J7601_01625 [Chloroflexi bacterium]|jgi:hypothetical protein|nr:hypothetical protein [Chloroflexota bacterium]
MGNWRRRALGKLILNAVLGRRSAFIIAAAIILVGLGVPIPVLSEPPLALSPVWWLAGLLPIWLIVVGLSIAQGFVSNALGEAFDLDQIRNTTLRANVRQALIYRQRINAAAARFADSGMRHRMRDLVDQVDEWVHNIYTLASRLDAFQSDRIIQRDLRDVPASINRLKERLRAEDDPSIKRELEETIRRRQAQYDNLRKLESAMDRADLQLENTLTALGTVYSQMLLLDAKEVDSSKAQRLRENIVAQVNALHDALVAMEEVYGNGQELFIRGQSNLGG